MSFDTSMFGDFNEPSTNVTKLLYNHMALPEILDIDLDINTAGKHWIERIKRIPVS